MISVHRIAVFDAMRFGGSKHGNTSFEGVFTRTQHKRKSFGSVESRNSYDHPDHSGYVTGLYPAWLRTN